MSDELPILTARCQCRGCAFEENKHLEGVHQKGTRCMDFQAIGIKLAGDILLGVCSDCAIEILKRFM